MIAKGGATLGLDDEANRVDAAHLADAEVIEACEQAGVAMVFTKHRHFRH